MLDPSIASLGSAYVDGEIDIEGTIDDVVDAAARMAGTGREAGRRRSLRRWRHTPSVDRDAIAYHYDVSDDFYRLWLDDEMVYSCAYFRQPDDDLETGQRQKLDHTLRKLRLGPGQRLLDIGCGWGALVLRAVRDFGVSAVGITLSANQHAWATRRARELGLEGKAEFRLQDYRDVDEPFDRIVSVGMFEHVGLANLRSYFTRIRGLLREGGLCLNHGITSTDVESSESPMGGGEFIGRYVFPHGELPHVSLAVRELSAAGLELVDAENLRHHYTLTLRHWSRRFEAGSGRIRALIGERRYRIWRAYLAGCAYGFQKNWVAVYQLLAVRDDEASGRAVPLTRDYMYGSPTQPG